MDYFATQERKLNTEIEVTIFVVNASVSLPRLTGGPCKVRNGPETKRNETKQIETKRNETDRNETKQIETKRKNNMASHCGQNLSFSNIRNSFLY